MNEIKFRLAEKSDIDDVFEVFKAAIQKMI